MKICQLTASVSRRAGGPFVSVRRLSQELDLAGLSVSVAGLWDIDTEADDQEWSPLSPKVAMPSLGGLGGFAPALGRIVSEANPDLIHTHGLWMFPTIVGARCARRRKIPHVISPRGMLEPWAWKYHAWKKRPIWWLWEKRNVESASLLHATSSIEADSIRALGLKNPVAVIPNGVDISCKERQRGSSNPRVLLFLSRIHPKKGLLNLVNAWKYLRPPGWRVVIAGPDEGGHLHVVKRAVERAGMSSVFTFPGAIYGEAKLDLLRDASLFVLPSFSENFGIAVAEALAMGVPVITTVGTPWRDLVTNRCGWWIDLSVEALIQALSDACGLSDEVRDEMGVRGRDLVSTKYSWPAIASEMVGVYEWLLFGGPVPGCVSLHYS